MFLAAKCAQPMAVTAKIRKSKSCEETKTEPHEEVAKHKLAETEVLFALRLGGTGYLSFLEGTSLVTLVL